MYEPGSPEQLAANLETLVGGAIGCDIALDGSITQGMECSGRVTLNGTAIGCNDANGWKLLDSRHIRLQGDACKQLMEKNADVEANFPCTIFTPG